MSDEVPRPRFEYGPYVQVACFCDQAIEGKDGVLSLIRLVDTLTHTAQSPEPPDAMPAFTRQMQLVICLKSGNARGRHSLAVIPELPNGETKPPMEFPAHLEGEERGLNIIASVLFRFDYEGLYYFWVELNGDRLTGIPLRVMYNPVRATSSRE